MTILVVDDEAQYRLLLRDLLKQSGHDVFVAENGADALQKLSRIEIDFIISDIYMPVMDGVKFHRAVREMPRYESLPFLFISGYSDEYTLGTATDPRFDGFFRKGHSPAELQEWITYLTTPVEKRGKFFPGQSHRSN